MFLKDKMIITINQNNKKYYSDLGYDISQGEIEVEIKDIQRKSSIMVNVLCDYCNSPKTPTYKSYMDSVERGGSYACKSCFSKKYKETCLKKWGVENISQLDNIKDKKRETILNKWGVDHFSQTEEYREKIKKTSNEKWGVDHFSQTEEYREKIKKTSLNRWGVDSHFKSDIIKEKILKTNLNKFGTENPFANELVKEKTKKTNLENFGVEYIFQSELIKEKIKKTNLEKYGNGSYSKTDNYFKDKKIISDENYLKYLDNSTHLFKCVEGHEFEINIDNYYNRKRLNISLCTICHPIGDFKSIKEEELFKFIKSIYFGEIIQSYRDGLEIDIYLPELEIGFEFNGLYWHSEKKKDRNYHLDKTRFFQERGIRIIHLWEDDWDFKKEIIQSQICNLLNKNINKISARKCEIREVKSVADFLNSNHIQGSDRSKIKIGLFYQNNLVSLMTFNQLEGRKKMKEGEWNLSRFCNLLNTSVIGGASKLLTYFIEKYQPTRIISYADRDWSQGYLYYTLGFSKIYESSPDYKYIINNRRKHKQNFKKSNLKISDITESKYMSDKNINRIWDCGKIKFEKYF